MINYNSHMQHSDYEMQDTTTALYLPYCLLHSNNFKTKTGFISSSILKHFRPPHCPKDKIQTLQQFSRLWTVLLSLYPIFWFVQCQKSCLTFFPGLCMYYFFCMKQSPTLSTHFYIDHS